MRSPARLVSGTSAVGIRNSSLSAVRALQLEEVLLELRQLAGAGQRLARHEIRHPGFAVAVLAHVQVEHELRERAMQRRHRSGHHRKARAGKAARRDRIEPAEPLADRHVIGRLEIETARLAVTANLDIRRRIAPGRHALVQQVRHVEQPPVDLRLQAIRATARRLQASRPATRLRRAAAPRPAPALSLRRSPSSACCVRCGARRPRSVLPCVSLPARVKASRSSA